MTPAAAIAADHAPSSDRMPMPVNVTGEPARASANVFLYAALARELREVRAMIEDMAETLVSDDRFVHDYIEELQRFDLIIQSTDESASLLDRLAGGSLACEAIEAVRLSAVQMRLRAALADS